MIFNSTIKSTITKYYPILCEISKNVAVHCIKGEEFTYNTPYAEITFKIK